MTTARNTVATFGLVVLALLVSHSSAMGDGCQANCDATCCADDQGNDGKWFEGLFTRICCQQEYRDLCERWAGCTLKVDASALFLHRANPSSVVLLTAPFDGSTLLNASDLEFPYRVGSRLSLVTTDCAGLGLELNYFSIDGWSARSAGGESLPFGTLTVDEFVHYPFDHSHFELSSMLYSSEINLRRQLFGGLDALCGFRWIDMLDRYSVQGFSIQSGNVPMGELIETRNHIFGGQIGLDGGLGPDDGKWRIGTFIKAGVGLNNANATTSLYDPGRLGELAAAATQCHGAFFGEAGLTGYFQISKHVAASIGYQVMYINNIAEPANQLAQTDLVAGTSQVNLDSGIFYHGANLGIDVNW
jgi:hypothetical protein